ncbi:MAG: hypothetical protein NT011_08490 [Kiritimatiellaeota bacterium]|nr:hypothetical protein [Kiritimatiellota bacterium]
MIHDNYAAGDKTRAQQPVCFEPNSSGMVLVVVVILAAVAGILAAGLHFASGARITQVRQEIRFEKAFFVAEAGIERAKDALRYTNLNDVLTNGGVLFGGVTNYGEGIFYAWVRNNTNFDPNPLVNTSDIVIIRSTGIVETATRVIEVEMRVTPFELGQAPADGAIGVYGTNSSLTIGGSGEIDGHDYDVPATFSCTGAGCNGTTNANPASAGLYSSTNLSISGTNAISGNPPIASGVSSNGYTETYWLEMANSLLPYATVYSGVGGMGTRDAPVITVLPPGTTSISGGNKVHGAGILIIPGTATLSVSGTFHYEGLVILLGDGVVDIGDEFSATGTVDIFGAIACAGGELDIRVWGSASLKHSTAALANLANITSLPAQMDMRSWREIKHSSTNW